MAGRSGERHRIRPLRRRRGCAKTAGANDLPLRREDCDDETDFRREDEAKAADPGEAHRLSESSCMNAVIPAAGLGMRFLPLTKAYAELEAKGLVEG